ncbi:MAG TPA: YwiC-like family protein [Lacunisphaera sp.]
MPATAEITLATLVRPTRPERPATTVFLPKEHGSWSLALEPLALGLLVAPSWAGGAFAVAALAGFFARRPCKALAAPVATRRRGVGSAVAVFSVVAAGALAIVLVLGGVTALWPLLLAAPLAALFAWFDAQNGSRAAAAEVAGSAAFAIMPAVAATLAGWSAWSALAFAGLALTRSVPTVLAVRCSLRRAKGETSRFTLPVLAAGVAAGAVSVLGAFRFVPAWAVVPPWVLFARTLWFARPSCPARPARSVGVFEAFLGLFYVGAIAAAYHAQPHAGI